MHRQSIQRKNPYIDVSVALSPKTITWPGSSSISFRKVLDIQRGDVANDTDLLLNIHTGTHVDAPSHFVPCGKSIDQIPLKLMIGKTHVVEVSECVDKVTSKTLSDLSIPKSVERLLIRTRNSRLWQQPNHEFNPEFVAVTADAAQWIVDRGIKLLGVDYLSIQGFYDGPEIHQIILGAEIVVIEGLNLSCVTAGRYEMICLPIKLQGVEGAPARVLLRH